MSNYSCAIKGSCCVILIGLMTILSQVGAFNGPLWPVCLLLLVLSTLAMSVFDAKYLQLERQYRVLYSLIDEAQGDEYPTDLKPCRPEKKTKTRRRDAYFSWSVIGFYSVVCCIGAASWFVLTFN